MTLFEKEEDAVWQRVLKGELNCPSKITAACKGNNILLGNVMKRLVEHRKEADESKLSGESVTSTESASGQVNQEEPAGVQEDGARKRPAVRKRRGTPKKQPRRKVSKEIRVQGDESAEGEGDVSRHGCLRDCFQRTRRLCFFWQ